MKKNEIILEYEEEEEYQQRLDFLSRFPTMTPEDAAAMLICQAIKEALESDAETYPVVYSKVHKLNRH